MRSAIVLKADNRPTGIPLKEPDEVRSHPNGRQLADRRSTEGTG
jgi:hypothetical protein